MVVVYTFGLGGYTGGCIYWYWVPVYMATGSWANTSNLAGKAKQSTTPQRLFGIWDSLKSQVWHSKFRLSNPAKNSTNTQRWTTTLPWQSLYRQVWSSISSLFYIGVNILNRWDQGISDRTKVYKILYSATEHWKAEFKSIFLFIFGDTTLFSGPGTPTQLPSLGSNGWRTWCR